VKGGAECGVRGSTRNWLIIGQAEAGSASALLCTFVANCREQKICPERYFEEAQRRRPVNATVEEAAELTPTKLASADP